MLTACLDTIKKELAFDIGFGDVIVPSPILMTYPTIINGMDNPRLVAYSLETVLAEKKYSLLQSLPTMSHWIDVGMPTARK